MSKEVSGLMKREMLVLVDRVNRTKMAKMSDERGLQTPAHPGNA
jgi:hypothetical protein